MFIGSATNRPDKSDSTLLRPGRLDQLIFFYLPDQPPCSRQEVTLPPEVSLEILAKSTHRFSGVALTEICQRAAKLAIREKDEAAGDDVMKLEDSAVPEISRTGRIAAVIRVREQLQDSLG
ncbi:hypothetical protein B0H11DRAFT_2270877 [Mycena galericulata]|nr:hypothetical protein B0H11DRAFT_2270877 [Mycena galericulata]